MIVSSIILHEGLMRNLSLFNQLESQGQKLPYFLAKYIPTSEFLNGYYVLPPLVEGENVIKGFDITLSTIGTYHFYFRAVILGQVNMWSSNREKSITQRLCQSTKCT